MQKAGCWPTSYRIGLSFQFSGLRDQHMDGRQKAWQVGRTRSTCKVIRRVSFLASHVVPLVLSPVLLSDIHTLVISLQTGCTLEPPCANITPGIPLSGYHFLGMKKKVGELNSGEKKAAKLARNTMLPQVTYILLRAVSEAARTLGRRSPNTLPALKCGVKVCMRWRPGPLERHSGAPYSNAT